MMYFMKACDRIDSEKIEKSMRTMNFVERIIKMIQLLHTESSVVIVTDNEVGESFRTRGRVKQGCPVWPFLLTIVLVVMEIEIRIEEETKGIPLKKRQNYNKF